MTGAARTFYFLTHFYSCHPPPLIPFLSLPVSLFRYFITLPLRLSFFTYTYYYLQLDLIDRDVYVDHHTSLPSIPHWLLGSPQYHLR